MGQACENKNIYIPVLKSSSGAALADDVRITDYDATLEIELSEDRYENILIKFVSYLSYRKINEFEAYRTLGLISSSSELGHIMYLAEKSDYLAWFQSEGMRAREDDSLFHFCITSYSGIIDVIALDFPTVNGRKLSTERLYINYVDVAVPADCLLPPVPIRGAVSAMPQSKIRCTVLGRDVMGRV